MQIPVFERVQAVIGSGPAAAKRLVGGLFGGRSAKKAAAQAEAGGEAAAVAVGGGGFRRFLDSPVIFRSLVGALVLMGTVQWALIFFNYWR